MIPTYEAPVETLVPVVADLGILSLPTALASRTKTPWLDADVS